MAMSEWISLGGILVTVLLAALAYAGRRIHTVHAEAQAGIRAAREEARAAAVEAKAAVGELEREHRLEHEKLWGELGRVRESMVRREEFSVVMEGLRAAIERLDQHIQGTNARLDRFLEHRRAAAGD